MGVEGEVVLFWLQGCTHDMILLGSRFPEYKDVIARTQASSWDSLVALNICPA